MAQIRPRCGIARSVRAVVAVLAVVALGIGVAACGGSSGAPTGTVVVRDASIDKPVNGVSAALRMIIDNRDGPDDRLVAASTDASERADLHESMVDDQGRASMERLSGIDIPAGKQVYFVPGSYHVMLSGLTRDLQVGDEVTVDLTFEHAGTRTVTAVVKPLGVND